MTDFVTFDLAKKLKEKGFKNNCIGYYDYAGEFHYNYESYIANKEIYFCHNKYDNIWHRDLVDAPTISQVLKWLREDKKIHIIIDVCNGNWEYSIKEKIRLDESLQYISQTTPVPICRSSSYEEAALEGIEYVIDNLI